MGEGTNRQAVPFKSWLAQIGLGEAEDDVIENEIPEITDEEIERALKMGRMKFLPPGTGVPNRDI